MTERRSTNSTLTSTLLLGVQLVVVVVSSFLVWFRAIEIPGCDQSCDFGLLNATSIIYALIAVAVLILTAVLTYRQPERWWLPLVGTALTLAVCYGANLVSDAALQQNLGTRLG